MKWLGSTLLGLMLIVVLTSLDALAIREGTVEAFKAVYSATALAFAFAIAVAWAGRHRFGAFWAGFASFGWAYLLLAIQPHFEPSDEFLPPTVNPCLLTSARVEEAARRVDEWLAAPNAPAPGGAASYAWPGRTVPKPRYHRVLVLHCLVAVWLGVIGGAVATALSSGPPRTREGAAR